MDRQNKKRMILLIAVSLLIYFVLYRKTDPGAFVSVVKKAEPGWLLLAMFCFFMYLICEGISFSYLFSRFGYSVPLRRTVGYTLTDFFFSSITPGGSGGQPGQLYFMLRDRIAPSACMTALFPFNMVYHFVLATFSILFFLRPETAPVRNSAVRPLVFYGIGAQLVLVLLLFLLIVSKGLVDGLIRHLFRLLSKIPFLRRAVRYESRVRSVAGEYEEQAEVLKRRPALILPLIGTIIAMLFFLYQIPYWIYRGLGFQGHSFSEIFMIQTLLVVAAESVPLPGGLGVSEGSMMSVFSGLVGSSGAFWWMLLERGFTRYAGLFIGGAVTVWMKPKDFSR